MLRGLHVSPVQDAAVELMLVSEERLRAHDFAERFKLAVVSSSPEKWVSKMFPQWGTTTSHDPEVEGEPEPISEDEDLSDTAGKWIFGDEISPEEALQILTEEREGTLSLEDLPDTGGDEGWQ